MFNQLLSLLAASALASAAVIPSSKIETRDTCNIAQAAPLLFVGGSDGSTFCDSHWPSADMIRHLQSWSKGPVMTGLQVTYASGIKVMHGTTGDASVSGKLDLSNGETITAASLRGDGKGDRLGQIHIETSLGAKVDLGSSSAKEYVLNDIGTGFLIGVTGQQGNEINSLALIFLGGVIDKVEITDLVFKEDIKTKNDEIAYGDKNFQHYYNDKSASSNLSEQYAGSYAVTKTNTFTQSSTWTFGQTIKVEMSLTIPEVISAGVSNELTWSVGGEKSSTQTSTTTDTKTYTRTINLAPGFGEDCNVLYGTGTSDFDYSATVKLHMHDGNVYSYVEDGQLHSVSTSTAADSCTGANHA